MKIISWNIAHQPQLWSKLLKTDADIALLQEACEPPPEIATRLDIGSGPWRTEGAGAKRPWKTTVVGLNPRVRLNRIPTVSIGVAEANDFSVSCAGSLDIANIEHLDSGEQITLVSMYATWERPHESTNGSWIYADASVHRLISDISALVGSQNKHRIIAAGDLNILHGYGENGSNYWATRYQTIFDRFAAIGLDFVGPQHPNGLQATPWRSELPKSSLNVPTFRTNKKQPESATRQLDFVFASSSISHRVKTYAKNSIDDWGDSDHCQVRIEVEL